MPTYDVCWHHVCRDRFTVDAGTPQAALDIALHGDPGEADCEVIDGIGYVVFPHREDDVLIDTRAAGEIGNPIRIDPAMIRWRPVGEHHDPENPHCRLKADLIIGPVSMHFEALQVKGDASERETPTPFCMSCIGINRDIDAIICGIYATTGADKPFETIAIDGRKYVMLATPFAK